MIENFLNPEYWLGLLYSLPAIIFSLSFHEFAHAYAAHKCGDNTAKNLGRMTLDPLAHLDLPGFLCLLLFGFGWAKPVPVNTNSLRHGKASERLVSLAGIAANFLLANVFTLILLIVIRFTSSEIVFRILISFVQINVVLMIFNLLPIPPLDGYRFLMTFINTYKHPKVPFFLEQYGNFILIALIILGITDFIIGGLGSIVMNALITAYSALINLFV